MDASFPTSDFSTFSALISLLSSSGLDSEGGLSSALSSSGFLFGAVKEQDNC